MNSIGSWNLEGSSTLGRFGLESVFDIIVLQLYSLVDSFWLEGPQRGFLLSTSVSSLITHLDVILYLYLSSLLFKLYLYCLLYMLIP